MKRDTETVFDEYLVLAAQGGSADAFRRLVERWTPRLRRHAGRALLDGEAAIDVVQETWLAVAKGLHRLDDPSRFAGWAFAIATRRCADEIRRRQRGRRLHKEVAATPTPPAQPNGNDPDRAIDLGAALALLPPDQRLLVSLFYGEGFSIEDLALALSVPSGTVKSRLYAARKSLKFFMEGTKHVPD